MNHRVFFLFLGVAVSSANAATFSEDFASAPAGQGWKMFGDTQLFRWNSTNKNMDVTWDSAQTNSYFYRPLGTVLTKSDSFSLQFDLQLQDIIAGVNPSKPSTFQLAVGLLNLRDARRTNFFAGSGVNATYGGRNLLEFNYFPEAGFISPTWATLAVSSNNVFAYGHNYPLELTPDDWFQIKLDYAPTTQTLTTTVRRNGEPFGLPPDNRMVDLVLTGKPDFRLDAVAIESYSDHQQPSPTYAGSLLAHGVVDNFLLTLPPPPVQNLRGFFSNAVWHVQFISRTNWLYRLEASTDLQNWSESSTSNNGTGGEIILSDTNSRPSPPRFYRVLAERP